MATVLFNTETGQITSRHERGYRVLGKPTHPEPPLVQLEYTEDPYPTIDNDTQRVEVTEEITDTTYHIRRTVIQLTEYERSLNSWLHPTYAIRIEAPAAMALSP